MTERIIPTRNWSALVLSLGLLVGGAVGGSVLTRALLAHPTPPKPTADEKASPADRATVTLNAAQQAAAGLKTTPVVVQPFEAHLWRTGRIALNEERLAHIRPPAEGIIREVPVRLGQTVKAGDVLATIDCRELTFLKLELVKARAALATEQESLARVQTITSNAGELLKLLTAETPLHVIVQRMADKPIGDWRSQLFGALTKRNQLRAQLASQRSSAGSLAEATLRKTEAEVDAANAAYTALVEELRYQVKSQVRQAELKHREAQTLVDVTQAKLVAFGLSPEAIAATDPLADGAKAALLVMRAPFAGTLVEKHAVLFERVGPTSQLFVLADLSSVWVQADVFESDLPHIRTRLEQPLTFRSTVAGITERAANVVYTGDVIDKASRALTLTAEAPNVDRALKPGMFVEVGFAVGDRTPVLQVPATALLRHENQPFVFVATEDDTFTRRPVTVGRSAGALVEIVSGLKAGESVVVSGGFVLKSELLKDQMAGE